MPAGSAVKRPAQGGPPNLGARVAKVGQRHQGRGVVARAAELCRCGVAARGSVGKGL